MSRRGLNIKVSHVMGFGNFNILNNYSFFDTTIDSNFTANYYIYVIDHGKKGIYYRHNGPGRLISSGVVAIERI